MALTAEDGSGVPSAESYASVALADAYWAARSHDALSSTWAGAAEADKEGALREATGFVDGTYGPFYIGQRRGFVQGLMWPRTFAKDEAGYELPALPKQVIEATCELAVRALSARLAGDQDFGGRVKRIKEKVGSLETETEYVDGAPSTTLYGSVAGLLASVLNGLQPDAAPGINATWHWR